MYNRHRLQQIWMKLNPLYLMQSTLPEASVVVEVGEVVAETEAAADAALNPPTPTIIKIIKTKINQSGQLLDMRMGLHRQPVLTIILMAVQLTIVQIL